MFRRITHIVLTGLAAILCASPVGAQDEKITVSGLLDWYYQYSFNHPPATSTLGARAFDTEHNSFSINLGEVTVNRAASDKNPVGFTATFTIGKTADIVHFTEPGGAETYKHIQQLFGTYVVQGGKPITIDFGKFVTAHGMEVIESTANDNYSRGLLFLYAIPFYHMGIRASTPLTDKLTGMVHLVNGWNNVEDDNGGKSIGLTFNFKPSVKWNFILNHMSGQEGGPSSPAAGFFGGIGFPTAAPLMTHLLDLVVVYSPSARLKLGLNADYADASSDTAPGGHWSGWALYLRQALSDKTAVALRYDRFDDRNGLRTGAAQHLTSLTGTFEYLLGSSVVSRLELRHDKAGTAMFPSGGGSGNRQTTFSYSQVYKF